MKKAKLLTNIKDKKNFAIYSLFSLGVIVGIVQLFLYWFLIEPHYFTNFPVLHQDCLNTCGDFVSINNFAIGFSPYIENNSSYPPLNFIFALPFACLSYYVSVILSTVLIYVTFVTMFGVLFYLFNKRYKPTTLTLGLLMAIVFFSTPFLFLLERTNYVFITFFFTAMFLFLKDSERFSVKICSFIFLAMAVGMKMYPAVFAILLLREKRYKDTLICAIISILLFFLPFFIFKGGFIENIKMFVHHLTDFASFERLSVDVSSGNCVRIIAYLFGLDYTTKAVSIIGLVLRIILFVLACVFSFVSKEVWQRVTLLSLTIVIFPMPAMVYSLLFALLGFVLWMTKKERGRIDVLYAVLFFIIIAPISYGFIISPVPAEVVFDGIYNVNPGYMGLSVQNFLQGVSVIVLTITICIQTLVNKKKENKTK